MKKFLFAALAALTLAGPLAARENPVSVIKSFDVAWNDHDAGRVLAMLAEDATLSFTIVPGQTATFTGKNQARGFVDQNIGGFRVSSTNQKAEGDSVTWQSDISNDRFRQMGVASVRMNSEALVVDGLIKSFKTVAAPESAQAVSAVMEQDERGKLRAFIEEVFNKHNISAIDQYVSPMFLDHSPFPGTTPDLEGLKSGVISFFGAFPDARVEIDSIVADGANAVVRMTSTGTQKGMFLGKAPTGRAFRIQEFHEVRFADGKMVEHWGLEDGAAMAEQLFAAPGAKKPAAAKPAAQKKP